MARESHLTEALNSRKDEYSKVLFEFLSNECNISNMDFSYLYVASLWFGGFYKEILKTQRRYIVRFFSILLFQWKSMFVYVLSEDWPCYILFDNLDVLEHFSFRCSWALL